MPNGRSGGFVIDKGDLKQLLKMQKDAILAGEVSADSLGDRAEVSDLTRLIDECPNDRIAVEEQYGCSYIIHLSNEPEAVWFDVRPDTPLFLELRRRHDRWKAEHPNWKEWIAF